MNFRPATSTWLLYFFALAPCIVVAGGPPPRPLARAHAHNDYQHPRPLLDALDHGFSSVEADVFLIGGRLLVGHSLLELKADRTLESLYLDPLRERARQNGGRIVAGGPAFTLLIDLKSDGPTAYAALYPVLARYEEMLTAVRGGKLVEKAVIAVLSGERPWDAVAMAEPRLAFLDGRLPDLERALSRDLVPLVSDHWGRNFGWRGDGPIPEAERTKLRDVVAKAHARGQRLRFWATPEKPDVWRELHAAGVDLINTDDLAGLEKFLRAIEPTPLPDAPSGPASGAVESSRDPSRRWAFAPPQAHWVPAPARASWARNAVDLFVCARLEAAGLEPSPAADRRTLIRRLSLDLAGVPPHPDDVDRFCAETSPAAYEDLADRLLASPRYGERWARHWLDVVRFAETNGFETNTPRANAWPYRDYVIEALNADLPYDRFVREQLAGDVLGEDRATGFLVGGPFDMVKSPDVELTLNQRANEIQDMVSTTAGTFLGLTAGCARCHNHKFDPIPQREYYGLSAVFAGVEHGERAWRQPDAAEPGRSAARIEEEIAGIDLCLRRLAPLAAVSGPVRRPAVSALGNVDRFVPLQAKFVRFTVTATNGSEPCIDELEVFTCGDSPRNVALASAGARTAASSVFPGNPLHRLDHLNDGRYGNGRSWISAEQGAGWVELELAAVETVDTVAWARDREGRFADRLPTGYRVEVAVEHGRWTLVASSGDRVPPGAARGSAASDSTAAEGSERHELEERRRLLAARLGAIQNGPRVYAGVFTQPPATHLLHRGDPMHPRDLVEPGGLSILGGGCEVPAGAPEAERRVALGRWIASAENPLTARVLVNRLWQHHFGEGLVGTPSDFGAMGSRPTHPELLDWLALRLVDEGWSVKRMQRLIVFSSTYRQSSRPRPEAAAVDAGVRLLWRYPPRRLDAEPLRDSILAVSGALDLRMGGPGFEVFEPNDNYVHVYIAKQAFGPREWRRMVYQSKPRMVEDATFGAFDCPDSAQPTPRRPRSTTPLQALNLLNSPFVVEQAALFAARVVREADPPAADRVEWAFRLALCRAPDRIEAAAARVLVEEHGIEALCRALFNASEFLHVE